MVTVSTMCQTAPSTAKRGALDASGLIMNDTLHFSQEDYTALYSAVLTLVKQGHAFIQTVRVGFKINYLFQNPGNRIQVSPLLVLGILPFPSPCSGH